MLTSDGTLSTYDQTSASTFDPTPNTTASAATLIWAGISADPTQVNPDYVYQDPTGAVNFFGSSGISALDATYRQNVGDGQIAVWVDDNGLYTFVFLDSDTRANIVAQYGDPHAAQFTDSIPMAIGLEEVYSLPSDPTQATLFAVDLDDTLNVLTKSPTTGWTQVPVHQDAATVEKVPSWRVQIDVLDANGAPVALGKVQIATDRPVGVWQPATTTTANAGNTVLTPSETITMTASLKGKVSFSIRRRTWTRPSSASRRSTPRRGQRCAVRRDPGHRRAQLPGRHRFAARPGDDLTHRPAQCEGGGREPPSSRCSPTSRTRRTSRPARRPSCRP